MKHKLFSRILRLCALMLAAAVCLSACSLTPPVPSATPAPTVAPTPSPTPVPTATPAPTPDPNLLNVEAGSFQGHYGDDSWDYLDYWVHIPKDAKKGLPLIVFLHGDGNVAAPETLSDCGIARRTEEIYGDDFPYILLTPCTHTYSWTYDSIMGLLVELINSVCQEYQCDTSRIAITGHSRGAIGVWKLVSVYGDFFSCAVPVSCGSEVGLNYDNFANVPVKGFCGQYDFEAMFDEMSLFVNSVNIYGGNGELTVLEEAHHGNADYYAFTQDTLEWMCAQ